MQEQKVLIFGASGQDGSYLTEKYIESSNSQVHCVVRRIENPNLRRAETMKNNRNLYLHLGDITDSVFVENIIAKVQPSIIFNLAAQSFVKASFDMPIHTHRVNFQGLTFVVKAIQKQEREAGIKIKLFHASTSQMFGEKNQQQILHELSPMEGVSPYGKSKLDAHNFCRKMREQKGLFISTAISFNHQSIRRPPHFVTRKVTQYVAKFYLLKGNIPPLQIGNLNAKRDWGHAKNYINGFISIVSLPEPDDFVLSTGQCFDVRFLVEATFKLIEIQIEWTGEKLDEVGFIKGEPSKILVKVCQKYFRERQVPFLKGNSNKIKQKTGWQADIKFQDLIKEMLQNDLKLQKKKIEDQQSQEE